MLKLEEVFELFSGYFVSYDPKRYMINYVQKGKDIVAREIGFSECMQLFAKENIFQSDEFKVDDIDFFVSNPYISGSFLFPFEKNNGTNQYYRITKKFFNDETIIYIEEFNDKNSLSTLTDPLTDVYRRDTIEQFVNNKININKDRNFYFMVLDIDNFKLYNDTYGHLVGDEVLKEIAKVFKKLYKNGFIGRVGGDEFVIVDFSTTDKEVIKKKCENLIDEVSTIKIKDVDCETISITIGVSFYPEEKTYRKLFEKADKKLYEGKRTGKHKYVI